MYRGVPPPWGTSWPPLGVPSTTYDGDCFWCEDSWWVGSQNCAWAADITRARPTSRAVVCVAVNFFSFFENFSKCFWLFKGEKIIFFKKFSNNGLVSKKNRKIFYHFLGGGVKTQSDKNHFFEPFPKWINQWHELRQCPHCVWLRAADSDGLPIERKL